MESITIGRCAVTLNPDNSIYPGEVFEVSSEIRPVLFGDSIAWRYSSGWDQYHVTGCTDTRDQAITRARFELIQMRGNWIARGDEVTNIQWAEVAREQIARLYAEAA